MCPSSCQVRTNGDTFSLWTHQHCSCKGILILRSGTPEKRSSNQNLCVELVDPSQKHELWYRVYLIHTVDGEILHQFRLVVFPIVHKVLYIPGGAGFFPSTVGRQSSVTRRNFPSFWSCSEQLAGWSRGKRLCASSLTETVNALQNKKQRSISGHIMITNFQNSICPWGKYIQIISQTHAIPFDAMPTPSNHPTSNNTSDASAARLLYLFHMHSRARGPVAMGEAHSSISGWYRWYGVLPRHLKEQYIYILDILCCTLYNSIFIYSTHAICSFDLQYIKIRMDTFVCTYSKSLIV